jgi:hypothetical protein
MPADALPDPTETTAAAGGVVDDAVRVGPAHAAAAGVGRRGGGAGEGRRGGDPGVARAVGAAGVGGADEAGTGPRRSVDEGSVTIEAALGLAALAVVLMACLAGIACLMAQLRCADAAREAARLAARGDESAARAAVTVLAPSGASLVLSGGGDLVTATVGASAVGGLLPGVTIEASASASREPPMGADR